VAELWGSRFLHEERIGAGIDEKSVMVLRHDDAAWSRPFFENPEGQASKLELIRGG
jgi:hypothetical protein